MNVPATPSCACVECAGASCQCGCQAGALKAAQASVPSCQCGAGCACGCGPDRACACGPTSS